MTGISKKKYLFLGKNFCTNVCLVAVFTPVFSYLRQLIETLNGKDRLSAIHSFYA